MDTQEWLANITIVGKGRFDPTFHDSKTPSLSISNKFSVLSSKESVVKGTMEEASGLRDAHLHIPGAKKSSGKSLTYCSFLCPQANWPLDALVLWNSY